MVTVLDDFEDGDIAEYSGSTGEYTVQQNTVYEGSYALETSGANQQDIYDPNVSLSQGDAPFGAYMAGGQTSGMYSTSSQRPQLLFGHQGSSLSGYGVEIAAYNDEFGLVRWDSGSETDLATATGLSLTVGEFYEVKITTWDSSGNIEAKLLDASGTELATVSATDTTYSNGYLGWCVTLDAATVDTPSRYDYAYDDEQTSTTVTESLVATSTVSTATTDTTQVTEASSASGVVSTSIAESLPTVMETLSVNGVTSVSNTDNGVASDNAAVSNVVSTSTTDAASASESAPTTASVSTNATEATAASETVNPQV